MGSKQQLTLRPISTMRDGRGFDGKANPSFRVYYSLRAGAVPFMWESAPGTPKRGAVAAASNAVVPSISPPPSYQSFDLKGRKGCRSRSSWPAGGFLRMLLGMLGLGARKSPRLSRRRPASYL